MQQERRISSCMAIFGATVSGFDLKVSSVSQMGAQVARALLNTDKIPIPEVSNIIKSDFYRTLGNSMIA